MCSTSASCSEDRASRWGETTNGQANLAWTEEAMKSVFRVAVGIAAWLAMSAPLAATAAQATSTSSQAAPIPYARADVLRLAEKVADYQLATMAAGYIPPNTSRDTADLKGWVQGALFVGLRDLADRSENPAYRQAILARGLANQWELGKRLYHADDHAIGTSYFWDARNGTGDKALANMRASFDAILANPPTVDLAFTQQADGSVPCQTRWCWCDALFMSPPVWFEMSNVTGDPKYREFAKAEFWATTAKLYDQDEHLYYRDSRFFDRKDINGKKVFWSRGDGWVFAGLARMIPLLPQTDPDRPKMIAVYKEMAAKLKTLQKADGYWVPSLLGDPETALPESSGTGFYTYGFAWGLKAGVLDRATYEPVVRKGWAALVRSVHKDGKLGYVQPVSDRPEAVDYADTQLYGVGAFLLAATTIADLDLKPAR
jgi:rhamnogalacturonyl hydrolase YesR